MGFIANIKRWVGMLFQSKATQEFKVKSITSQAMDTFIAKCMYIYQGQPYWLDEKNHIKTVNLAQFICSEASKLATLGINIEIDGDTDRTARLQKQIADVKDELRQWVELSGAAGTVILKPNGDSIDVVLPGDYMVTDSSNGKITGIVFVNSETSSDGKVFYKRLEYHRWEGKTYAITNKCFRSDSSDQLGRPISIDQTPWQGMEEEAYIDAGIDGMLFGVLDMPGANTVDVKSPLSTAIFANAIEELKDLDVAYSRNSKEIYDSKRIVLMDSDRLVPMPGTYAQTAEGKKERAIKMGLPDYVNVIEGTGEGDLYHEINPALNTEMRAKGINALLSQIGFKCGFSNGYFVFNESTGFTTATQVTADQSRTIQLVEDIRAKLDECIIDLIKALNVFEDIYGESRHIDISDAISTADADRMIHIHYEPIYTNKEEDRMRALQLTNSGYFPKWYYLHMYEGMSIDEAKALTEEARPKEQGLFDE